MYMGTVTKIHTRMNAVLEKKIGTALRNARRYAVQDEKMSVVMSSTEIGTAVGKRKGVAIDERIDETTRSAGRDVAMY